MTVPILSGCLDFGGRSEAMLTKQEFNRIVLCHQLWLKTEADEIRKDITYAR